MAKLKIQEIGRNWWKRSSRRDIFINGKLSGVLSSDEIELEVEPGPCQITIQNSFPTYRTTTYLNVEDNAINHVEFRDTKWFLNFLMAANVVLTFLRGLIPMPEFIRRTSNSYSFLWIIFCTLCRNGYFKVFAYSRISITS